MISVQLNCSYSMCSVLPVPQAMRALLLPNPLRNLFREKAKTKHTKILFTREREREHKLYIYIV